jgi:hypothetical protein
VLWPGGPPWILIGAGEGFHVAEAPLNTIQLAKPCAAGPLAGEIRGKEAEVRLHRAVCTGAQLCSRAQPARGGLEELVERAWDGSERPLRQTATLAPVV